MKPNVVPRCLLFKVCFAALAAERHAQSQPQGPGACTVGDASGACTAGEDAGQLMADEQADIHMERIHGVRGYACPEPDP